MADRVTCTLDRGGLARHPLRKGEKVVGNQWKDKGVCCNADHDIPNMFLPASMQTDSHKVENTETGEERQIRVDAGQTVGEAIAKGQFED